MPKLNSLQRGILAVSVFLFVLVGVYPPWNEITRRGSQTTIVPHGFHAIYDAPNPVNSGTRYITNYAIDWSILIILWVVVGVACLGMIWLSESVDTLNLLNKFTTAWRFSCEQVMNKYGGNKVRLVHVLAIILVLLILNLINLLTVQNADTPDVAPASVPASRL